MIVDSSLANLRHLADILQGRGYRVHPCASAKLALAAVTGKMPNLILLDLDAADLDSYEICRRLKADRRSADVPILFMGRHDDHDRTTKAFESGFDDCICKPLIEAEVLARVDTHLRVQELSVILDQQVEERTMALTDANRKLHQTSETRRREDTLIQLRLKLIEYATCHTLHELMQKSLDEVELLTQSKIGFYHFVHSDQNTLTLKAWSTNTAAKFCKADGYDMHYGIDEAGVWVDCVRLKRPVIHNDYNSLPNKKGMPAGHAEIVRQLVVPIFRDAKIVSILGIGNKETDYTQEDVQVASYCANLIWEITAHKQAQEALALSEQKYSKAFNNSPVWVVLSTLSNGRYLEVNETFLRTTGYTRKEVIGRTSREIGTWVRPDDRQTIIKAIKRQGHIRNYEVQRLTKSGKVISMLFSAEVIEVSGESCLLSVSQDISSRIQVEKALRDSEERFRHLFQQAPFPLMIMNLDGTVQHINDRFAEIYGYTIDDISTIDELWPSAYPDPAYRDQILKDWNQHFRTAQKRGKPVKPVVSNLKCKHGQVRTVELSAIFLGDTLLTTWIDLTEQRKVQDEINQRKQFLELVLSHLPDAVVTLDPEHRVVDWNPGAVKMFGYTPQEAIGRNLDDLVSCGKEYIEAAHKTKHVLAGERVEAFETVRYRKDGTPLNVIAAGSPIMNDDSLTGVVAVYTDISEQKKIQDERKEYEARIQQMQKMEAIGTLAGGIAHDFNNILSGVIGYAELSLAENQGETALSRNLKHILAGGRRAGDLVRQILTFSRQNERELKPLQIGSLFKEALKLLRSSLPTTIEIVQHIAPEVENVMADPTQIHQIIMNLCTNAAQSMEEGGRLVAQLSQVELTERDVGMQPGVEPGVFAEISVQDSGYGILPENIERIYNPYFTTKKTGRGTGLGLSMVHGIVQSYGGFINVNSTPGEGTTFDVYIPTIEAPFLPEETEEVILSTGSERILVVDDEAVLVDVIEGILDFMGYRVTTANSSLEALEKFSSKPTEFDLVLTDMTMPDMTGIQLSSKIREVRPDIPIVLCTGYSHQLSNNRAEDLGLQAIVMKPILKDDLARTIRNVLDTA